MGQEAAAAPDPPLKQETTISLEVDDILRVYQMAKIGMHKAQWRPSRKMAAAYSRVRDELKRTGAIPS